MTETGGTAPADIEIPSRDPETGAINRALLIEAATPMLSLAKRYARAMAFLHIHVIGLAEAVTELEEHERKSFLRDVTERIMAGVRDSDFVASVGEGRFVVALTELWEPDSAVRVASRLLGSLREMSSEERTYHPRVGVSFFPTDADSLHELLEMARNAVDRLSDGASVAFVDPAVGERALQRAGLERDLLGEPQTDQFRLFYQPIFGMDSGNVVGVEALIRWVHPVRGLLPAGPEPQLR